MNKKLRTLTIVSLILGAFASASPLYAHEKAKPSTDQDMMMKGGSMGGTDMMGMMGMMEQMNKMMGFCNKMMESRMDGKGGSDMKMPTEPPAAPEKKS